MKNLLVGLIIFGLTTHVFAQESSQEPEALDEINIMGVNYKYLNAVGASEAAAPVKILERRAANYDLENSKFYVDEHYIYNVYFTIPNGKILAVYDGESGEILSTAEKFTDIALPLPVANSIIDNYSGWKVVGDIYLVKYRADIRGTKRTYKILLEKNGKYKKIKTDDQGKTFI